MTLGNRKKVENKVAKAGMIYTLGNYLLKGIGFITVPIFSRLMTTSDFGIFNTFLTYEAILYLFLGLALHSSMKNAKYEYGDEQVDSFTSSIIIVPIIVAIGMFVLGNLCESLLLKWLKLDYFLINLLILYSLSTAILYIYRARMILVYKTRSYMKLSYFNAIASVVFSLLLIWFVYPNSRYKGRIVGTTIPMILIALYILHIQFKAATPRINKKYLKFGLKLSIPVIPHGIGQILLSSFDRVMITNLVSASASGLYSFAYTIYSILLVAGNSISAVFEPWAFEKLATNDKSSLLKRSSQFVIGIALVSLLIMLVAPELVIILGSEKYREAIPAVYPVLFGGFFAMVYTMPAVVEYYKKKTFAIALGTVGAAVVNLVLNAIFIPRFGFIAAAYTTLVSYALYYIFHTIIAFILCGFHVVPIKVSICGTAILTGGTVIASSFEKNFVFRFSLVIVICGGLLIYLLKNKKDL